MDNHSPVNYPKIVHSFLKCGSIIFLFRLFQSSLEGKTTTYKAGETYFIPAGLRHQITLCPGYSEVDYVDDPKDGELK